MKTPEATKRGITPYNMTTVDEALDLIARKIPALADRALRIKVRPNAILKVKATNALIQEALAVDHATGQLTKKDRTDLAKMVQPVIDGTKSVPIPPVRVTSAQFRDLTDAAQKNGRTVSEEIRFRLFGTS